MKSFSARQAATIALLVAAAQANQAQTIYRCGNSYSQAPCAGGTALQLEDPRSEAQRQAAVQGTERDMALARTLEESRHQDEALALEREKVRQAALSHQAAAHKKQEERHAASARAHKKPSGLRSVQVQEPGVFEALAGPVPPKKKSRAKSP